MFEVLRDLFTKQEGQPAAGVPEGFDRLAVATCAVLLETAHADEELSDGERAGMAELLGRRFGLTPPQVSELLDAAEKARQRQADLWHFTRAINEAYAPAEKTRLIEEVWRVIYADGVLNAHEDHLVHRLAELLNLNHAQLIDAKLRVKDELGL